MQLYSNSTYIVAENKSGEANLINQQNEAELWSLELSGHSLLYLLDRQDRHFYSSHVRQDS